MGIWHVTPALEHLNQWSKDTAVEHLGIEFVEVGEDYMVARMPVDSRTVQPMRLLHGGASVLLAETIGSSAANCMVDQTKFRGVGLEINANHLRSATEGWVYATAKPVHVGRNTQVWSIEIKDEKGRMVCISRLTVAILPIPV